MPDNGSPSRDLRQIRPLDPRRLILDIPEDERPSTRLLPPFIHRTPPPPQHDHPAGQHHTLVRPAPAPDIDAVVLVLLAVIRDPGLVVDGAVDIRGRGLGRAGGGGLRGAVVGVEVFHHGDALPAWDVLLRGEGVQDAGAVEGFGVVAGAGEGEVITAFLCVGLICGRGGGGGGGEGRWSVGRCWGCGEMVGRRGAGATTVVCWSLDVLDGAL